MSTTATAHDLLFEQFRAPPISFGPIPFWFWNDDLEEEELIRQLRAFHAAGCGGVIPHARMGLSQRIGYLSDTFLTLIRRTVEEAERLGMKVILYDEASYPSGSAHGAVAAANPAYVSQAIGLWEKEIQGPCQGYWRPPVGRALRDRHVASCLGRLVEGRIDPTTLLPLTPCAHDILPYDVGAGRWLLMSVWNTDSGGYIRGAYPHEESGSALAPAAGDILNPAAVAAFVRSTHERYAAAVGRHFGATIVAMFTDEPSLFGKGPRRLDQPQPYTPGFLCWLQDRWEAEGNQYAGDLSTWLPALWRDFGPRTESFRRSYHAGVAARMQEVFYTAQSEWCRRHGLALTGHPAASNDTASLAHFHLPGQDTVWRWVSPGSSSALEGDHAVAPKAAAAAARLRGRRRCLTEVCGAYGWQLTLAETKWLFDWHLVRGNNLINPHAFFYSIDGRRAYESEPDLGVHNVWWPLIPHLLRYAARVSWLLSDAERVAPIGVVGDGAALPWQAASILLQGQYDFDYVTVADVVDARLEDGHLAVGAGARFRHLVIDLSAAAAAELSRDLARIRAAGVDVVDSWRNAADLLAQLATMTVAPRWSPPSADVRLCHVRKAGFDAFFVVNEGETAVEGDLWLPACGAVESWDALRLHRGPRSGRPHEEGQWVDGLVLPPRESLILVVDPRRSRCPSPRQPPSRTPVPLTAVWHVTDADGRPCDLAVGQDWSKTAARALFSGTLSYRARIEVRTAASGLDLGQVADLAEVYIDGEYCGVSLWPPHVVDTDISPGMHDLEIRVTNSMVNEYEGEQRPSGLLGPVALLV